MKEESHLIETIIFMAILGFVLSYLLKIKKQAEQFRQMVYDHIHANKAMRETLAMGLYYRFNQRNEQILAEKAQSSGSKYEDVSSTFALQTPADFGKFVADVMRRINGGKTYVVSSGDDSDIMLEHEREDGFYIGQIRCDQHPVSYERIAVLHSQMMKLNAKGSFYVTTSDFSDAARQYAEGLNMELINGIKLVELWMQSLEQQKTTARSLPKPIA